MARKRGAPSAPQKSKDKGSKAFEAVRKRARAAGNATANRLDRENRRSGLFRGGI